MHNTKQTMHPLAEKFDRLGRKQQKHYREAWIIATGQSRQNFKKRIERPYIIDLTLWQYIFNEVMVIDSIYKYEKPDFEKMGIVPFKGQHFLFAQPKAEKA